MIVEKEVLDILDGVLSLKGRGADFQRDTPLLGALPELDSMAVLGIITTLEERYGLTIDDGDIESADFATLGSLADFLAAKLKTK